MTPVDNNIEFSSVTGVSLGVTNPKQNLAHLEGVSNRLNSAAARINQGQGFSGRSL